MVKSNIQHLQDAIDDMVTVDWSETDGKDVSEILASHDIKKGTVTKEELESVSGINLFMREMIGKCLEI